MLSLHWDYQTNLKLGKVKLRFNCLFHVKMASGLGQGVQVNFAGQLTKFMQSFQANSEHPLAKAIVEYAKKFREDEENQTWPEARDFTSVTGHGVKAIVQNKEILVGNKSLMLDQGIHVPFEAVELLDEAEGMAQTGILVSIGGEMTGVIAISDPLKHGARDAISILKSMNIKSIMVTGDNKGTAYSIAQEVGIEIVIAEARPEQKAEKVKELQVWFSGCLSYSTASSNRLLIVQLEEPKTYFRAHPS